jgi:S-adenosylmethionine-diacylglycerol 3-amino-3-carboxypropyl transferase
MTTTMTSSWSNTAMSALTKITEVGSKALALNTTNSKALYSAGAVFGLAMGSYIVKKSFSLMDVICNRTYIYNICWEDPAVDHEILKITPEDVIFRICSAGDIVLDYAIEGPSKIVVCDKNQHQLWLFELKIRMLRDPKLIYDEWWGIWGSSDVTIALKVWKRMRHTMSAGGRHWWDGRIERVFQQGFVTTGSTGFCSKYLIPIIMYCVGFDIREWTRTGFSHDYIQANKHILQRAAWYMRYLFPTIIAPFMGVPQTQIGPEFYTDKFYETILKEVFLDPEFGASNYFYRFYFDKGYKDQSCCPRTLQPEHFDALRKNSTCFEWHHSTVQETMERVTPHSFTKLVLLDHMDWMTNSMVHEEWLALQRATVPGAKILWRSAFSHTNDKPFFNNLDVHDLSPQWYTKDRVKMYPGTFLSYMPRDPFPFIDPEPSPCQKASFARKLCTTAKMIVHPLVARHMSAHGDKMSSFYASQARGYDAVRESMLVARPDMISAFGPIQQGHHTWLDIGGGTGRNLHYLRAQLDCFATIVVLDICPELLEMGKESARQSFPREHCERIHWVCLDVNDPNIRTKLASKVVAFNIDRGFDTITFSYSLSMIPEWEKALYSAKSLLSNDGRVLVTDFDTYTKAGTSWKDNLIRMWYKQDGVRIDAKSRDTILNTVFAGDEYTNTCLRMQRNLMGVPIPHYVTCCRRHNKGSTITTTTKTTTMVCDGFRPTSLPDYTKVAATQALEEEKKDSA